MLDRVEASQTRVLNSLLTSARVLRLVEQQTIDGAAAYAPLDFLADIRKGVFSEVYGAAATPIDAYRRNLQRAYVETLSSRVNGAQAQSDDVRAFFRGELKTLESDLAPNGSYRPSDRESAMHVQDLRIQIARALDPTVQATAAAGRAGTELEDEFDVTRASESCWIDYAVKPKKRN